jgi:hypothetical protein
MTFSNAISSQTVRTPSAMIDELQTVGLKRRKLGGSPPPDDRGRDHSDFIISQMSATVALGCNSCSKLVQDGTCSARARL